MVRKELELPFDVVCRVNQSYGTSFMYAIRDPYDEHPDSPDTTGLMVGFNAVVRGRNLGHYVSVTRET